MFLLLHKKNKERKNSKIKFPIRLSIILFALFKYYSNSNVNEFTGKKRNISMSANQEIALELQSALYLTQQHDGLYLDQKFQNFVDKVGFKLINNSIASKKHIPTTFFY